MATCRTRSVLALAMVLGIAVALAIGGPARAEGAQPEQKSGWAKEFDATADGWSKLAAQGHLKFMTPCVAPGDWMTTPEQLKRLGLDQAEVPALRAAYTKSNRRLWSVARGLCTARPNSTDDPSWEGILTACMSLMLDQARTDDLEGLYEVMRQVGEIRAGTRPLPSRTPALTTMLLAFTGEMDLFEKDLARSFGAPRAHLLAYADSMCMEQRVTLYGQPRTRK